MLSGILITYIQRKQRQNIDFEDGNQEGGKGVGYQTMQCMLVAMTTFIVEADTCLRPRQWPAERL